MYGMQWFLFLSFSTFPFRLCAPSFFLPKDSFLHTEMRTWLKVLLSEKQAVVVDLDAV